MYMRTMDQGWLMEHAARGPDDVWRCRKTKAEVEMRIVMREVVPFRGNGHRSHLEQVAHYFCQTCDPEPIFPEDGAPIHEQEVIRNGELACINAA